MRLWSIHPKYLDSKGLVAAWREALLAKKVLRGMTKGYRHHPQLIRFKQSAHPIRAINFFLTELLRESVRRGYRFDRSKVGKIGTAKRIAVTAGQLSYELAFLKKKLRKRSPGQFKEIRRAMHAVPHPLFRMIPGSVAGWEKQK